LEATVSFTAHVEISFGLVAGLSVALIAVLKEAFMVTGTIVGMRISACLWFSVAFLRSLAADPDERYSGRTE
jgi:hypothetical protein